MTSASDSETDLEEYDCYLRGHDLIYRSTPEDMEKLELEELRQLRRLVGSTFGTGFVWIAYVDPK